MQTSLIALLLWLAVPSQDPAADLLRARELAANEQWEDAAELFSRIAAADPSQGQAHYYLAQLGRRLDWSHTRILHHFRSATKLLPPNQVLLREYGGWLLLNRYHDAAQGVFRQLTSAFGDSPQNWILLGHALYTIGKPFESIQVYEKAFSLGSPTARLNYLTGIALRALGRHREAEAMLRQGLQLSPTDVEMRVQLAELLTGQGRLAEAGRYWDGLPESDPRRLFGRGWVQSLEGDNSGARELLRQFIELEPENARAYYLLGLICSRIGELAAARLHFERFDALRIAEQDRRDSESSNVVVEQSGIEPPTARPL